ncbi:hypothetical protein [Clostridium sp. YIM B02555]|uniref:hypothetical protein n=1 Tax=Clostridium sp. YIM B02555 TaxID=2911968 RepID=UPI001EEEEA84|nr:hypothetical protein [Clostridium sp. YIM B02555]
MPDIDLFSIVSKYAKAESFDFTGYLMYKDKEVAEIKDTNFVKSFDDNLLPGVLNDKALEKSWYSTSFTKNNYKPILNEYNYEMPNINFDSIKLIISNTLKGFPSLESDAEFKNVVLKIIENNYNELLN